VPRRLGGLCGRAEHEHNHITGMDLDYAPPIAWYRLRRTRRWALAAVWTAAATLAAIRWGPEAMRRAAIARAEYQCRTYAYVDRPIVTGQFQRTPDGVYGHVVWDANPAGAVPCLDRYRALAAPRMYAPGTTAFLHSRTSRSGRKFVVALDVYPTDRASAGQGFGYRCYAFQTGAAFAAERRERDGSWEIFGLPFVDGVRVSFYPGKPDPDDPAHFTLRFVASDGAEHIADGWVLDDGTVCIGNRLDGRPWKPSGLE
jgi:hypothetical protein